MIDYHGRLLVSFSGRYLKSEYCVTTPHSWTGENISCAFENQLYKIYIPHTEPNLLGPAFIEVGLLCNEYFFFADILIWMFILCIAKLPHWEHLVSTVFTAGPAKIYSFFHCSDLSFIIIMWLVDLQNISFMLIIQIFLFLYVILTVLRFLYLFCRWRMNLVYQTLFLFSLGTKRFPLR